MLRGFIHQGLVDRGLSVFSRLVNVDLNAANYMIDGNAFPRRNTMKYKTLPWRYFALLCSKHSPKR